MVWQVSSSDPQVTPDLTAALGEDSLEENAPKQKRANRRRRKTWREILGTRRYWVYGFAISTCVLVLASLLTPNLMMNRKAATQVAEMSQRREAEMRSQQSRESSGDR